MAKLSQSMKRLIGIIITIAVLSIILGIILWLKTPGGGSMGNMDRGAARIASTDMMLTAQSNAQSWNMLGNTAQNLTQPFMKPFGQWFIFVIFLILFIMFIFGTLTIVSIARKRPRVAAYSGSNGGFVKKMTNSLSIISSPFGKKAYNPIPRLPETNGRCNNVNWISVEDKNKKISLCFDTSFKQPDPVRFIIDPTKLYEYDRLPNAIKQRIRTDSGKLSITVPYTYNDKPSSYVLNFKEAVFEDGTPASSLFDQRFNYEEWMFETKNLTSVGANRQNYKYTYRYRYPRTSSNYSGLDVYK